MLFAVAKRSTSGTPHLAAASRNMRGLSFQSSWSRSLLSLSASTFRCDLMYCGQRVILHSPQMSKSLRSSRISAGLRLVPDMRMATTAWLSSYN